MIRKETRTIKIAGKDREAVIVTGPDWYEVQVRVVPGDDRFLRRIGSTLPIAIHEVEEAVKHFEQYRSLVRDPVLAERSRRRRELEKNGGGRTFSPKTFRELGGKP